MKKSLLAIACCCLGAAVSALLPWGVVRWGESLAGKPFSLPAIAYRLPEEQAPEPSGLDQVLLLLEQGDREVSVTVDPAEVDAFTLMEKVRGEIGLLQNLGALPAGDYSFPRPAMLVRYSLPDSGAAELWEFTVLFGEETVCLHYDPVSGRVLALERDQPGDGSSLPVEVRDGYASYLAGASLPGEVKFQVDGKTFFLYPGYKEDT